MSVLIKHMAMPKGCIYANDKDQTDYCPMLNHDDVPFCQYIENEPEIAIGIDERPVYCPLSDVLDTNVGDLISRQAAIDALRAMQTYKLFAGDDMRVIDQAGAQTELMLLPPAQPTFNARDTQYNIPIGTDMISRQAAIDAVCKDNCDGREGCRYYPHCTSINTLVKLPAVEPQGVEWLLTIGKDGKARIHEGKHPIVIYCKSRKEQEKVREMLKNMIFVQ